MERRIVSVSQINAYIKNAIDSDFLLQNIWIKGEISNFKLHFSGHMYLSLKDEGGLIRAVMFKNANSALKFIPENGMQVLARGRISVFAKDGSYQLYIDEMEPEGVGALYVAFEQLKAKLEKEGLFDQAHKKPLPSFPQNIGVVTSATGAAIKDILNILNRRWRFANVILAPVLVQGDGAAESIAEAIYKFNATQSADVLIVGRGGGSQEDLWAFNEEVVARAVFDSSIPVISAVGHEIDFTICDFVSDLRAPTPSAAAELVVPDEGEFRELLNGYEKRLVASLSLSVSRKREHLLRLSGRMDIIKRQLEEKAYTVDTLTEKLINAVTKLLEIKKQRLSGNVVALDALSPLKVLSRGYSVTTKDGETIKSVTTVNKNDTLDIRFTDGHASCIVTEIERSAENEL